MANTIINSGPSRGMDSEQGEKQGEAVAGLIFVDGGGEREGGK
jgi:hypothetical protein